MADREDRLKHEGFYELPDTTSATARKSELGRPRARPKVEIRSLDRPLSGASSVASPKRQARDRESERAHPDQAKRPSTTTPTSYPLVKVSARPNDERETDPDAPADSLHRESPRKAQVKNEDVENSGRVTGLYIPPPSLDRSVDDRLHRDATQGLVSKNASAIGPTPARVDRPLARPVARKHGIEKQVAADEQGNSEPEHGSSITSELVKRGYGIRGSKPKPCPASSEAEVREHGNHANAPSDPTSSASVRERVPLSPNRHMDSKGLGYSARAPPLTASVSTEDASESMNEVREDSILGSTTDRPSAGNDEKKRVTFAAKNERISTRTPGFVRVPETASLRHLHTGGSRPTAVHPDGANEGRSVVRLSRLIPAGASDDGSIAVWEPSRRSVQRTGRLVPALGRVRSWPEGYEPNVLFARDTGREGKKTDTPRLRATKLVKCPHTDDRDIVYSDSPFEIRVVGVYQAGQEQANASKLLPVLERTQSLRRRKRVLYSTRLEGPPYHAEQTQIPAVHYDFRRESRNEAAKEYIAVPHSRSLVTRAFGSPKRQSVCLKLALIQTDDDVGREGRRSSLAQASLEQALESVDIFNGALASLSAADVPYLSMLTPFIQVAASLGTAALEQAGRHDRIVDSEISFRLASRNPEENRAGEMYLRYGYYFFLSHPATALLYTQVETPEHVRLVARLPSGPVCMDPVRHLSYVVVRVSEAPRVPRPLPKPGQQSSADAHTGSPVFPPLAVQDVEELRQALAQARECPAEELKARLVYLLDSLKS